MLSCFKGTLTPEVFIRDDGTRIEYFREKCSDIDYGEVYAQFEELGKGQYLLRKTIRK